MRGQGVRSVAQVPGVRSQEITIDDPSNTNNNDSSNNNDSDERVTGPPHPPSNSIR